MYYVGFIYFYSVDLCIARRHRTIPQINGDGNNTNHSAKITVSRSQKEISIEQLRSLPSLAKMTRINLGFLKSSTTSTDKSFLVDNNTSKSPWGEIPSSKSKQYLTLRRKRSNSQSQPLFNQGNRSASPPRAINPLAEIAAALAITSSTSTNSSKRLAESLEQSPPAGIQTSRETRGRLLHEVTERMATIEALDSMVNYNQTFQKSENLNRRKTRQDKLDSNSEINQQNSLSYSLSSSSSIIASKTAGSPLAPYIARHEQEQIEIAVQRYSKVSKFHHVLEVLQRAARRVEADQSISQVNVFRSLAPLTIFLYIIGMGVLLPGQQRYRSSQTPEENTSVARMILLFFVGMALTLVLLKGIVRLVSIFGKTFCEIDLTEIFRKGECVDVDGRGKGEAELILGGMFL